MALDWGSGARGGATGAMAGSSFGPWGSAIGGTLGAIGGLFGGSDEKDETDKILAQIPAEMRQYLQPYIDAGMVSLPNLRSISDQYAKLYENPNDIISRIGSGYTQSPGYQWQLNQGENAINNAAAAGGMIGTGQHQQQAGQLATNLANQDYQNYLDKALGVFNTGLAGRTGIESGIFNTGADASGTLATSIANALMGQAGLNYKRSANNNQLNSDLMSSIISVLGKK